MNLVSHLEHRAETHPDRTALIDAQGNLSYLELYQKVCSVSTVLQNSSLHLGDRVLLLHPVNKELYIYLLGILHAGFTVMLIDPSVGNQILQITLTKYPPQAFLAIPKAHLLRISIPQLRGLKHYFHSSGFVPFSQKLNSSNKYTTKPTSIDSNHLALITFTSGSTGTPKAACRTHHFLLAQHKALSASLDFREQEIDLITLPVFGIANLASGMTSVIADTDLRYPAKADRDKVSNQIESHKITRSAASPAFFKQLLGHSAIEHLKTVYLGGAPVFPSLLVKLEKQHPSTEFSTVYGSTEAEPISHQIWNQVSQEDREAIYRGQGLLVGLPVQQIELMIIPSTCDEIAALPTNQIGEIAVSGDHVLKSYLNTEDNLNVKFKHHGKIWHRTGDAGYLDEQGRLWLQGRVNACIQRQGFSIYPFSIECQVMHLLGVGSCAIIEHEGKITLVLEKKLRVEQSNLLHSEFTWLEKIRVISSIPMDQRHNAKVNYPQLTKCLKN